IGMLRQPGAARWAASMAALASSTPALANSPITSSVLAGFTFGSHLPLIGSRHSPSIRSWYRFIGFESLSTRLITYNSHRVDQFANRVDADTDFVAFLQRERIRRHNSRAGEKVHTIVKFLAPAQVIDKLCKWAVDLLS